MLMKVQIFHEPLPFRHFFFPIVADFWSFMEDAAILWYRLSIIIFQVSGTLFNFELLARDFNLYKVSVEIFTLSDLLKRK